MACSTSVWVKRQDKSTAQATLFPANTACCYSSWSSINTLFFAWCLLYHLSNSDISAKFHSEDELGRKSEPAAITSEMAHHWQNLFRSWCRWSMKEEYSCLLRIRLPRFPPKRNHYYWIQWKANRPYWPSHRLRSSDLNEDTRDGSIGTLSVPDITGHSLGEEHHCHVQYLRQKYHITYESHFTIQFIGIVPVNSRYWAMVLSIWTGCRLI